MGKTSAIEWCDASHNFWYGCTKVSEGCAHCFAEREMKRFGRNFNTLTRAKGFDKPLRWKEPKKILISSWADFFHPDVSEAWRTDAYRIMQATPQHTYLILTKRPEQMTMRLPMGWFSGGGNPYPNVWLGVSAENQKRADERIPQLLKIPAIVHFVSAEPLLSEIDLSAYFDCGLAWCIIGAESGKYRRPMKEDWVKKLVQQCQNANVAVFYKQQFKSGKKISMPILNRKRYTEFPQITVKPNVN